MGKILSTPKIHIEGEKEVEGLWNDLLPLIQNGEWNKVNTILQNQSLVINSITERNYNKMINNEIDIFTPLQLALIYEAPIFIISLLLNISPKALVIKDSTTERYTPLFFLITNVMDNCSHSKTSNNSNSSKTNQGKMLNIHKYFNRELLQLILMKDTACLKIADNNGLLPLHKALECRLDSELIIILIQTDSSTVSTRTNLGKLPLHYAAEFKGSIEVFQLLLQYHAVATIEMYDRRLPLHYAVECRADPAVVKLLLHYKVTDSNNEIIQISHSGVQTRSYDGMLPIHIAVQHQASIDVIALLVQEYPDGLIQKDRLNRIPLHYALEKQLPEPIIQLLVSSNLESVSIRNRGSPGNYPLSIAIEAHYSHSIIHLLVSAYPEAVKEPNIKGMLPLRATLRHSSNTAFKYRADTISLLLSKYPEAANEVDEHLRIALHYACSRNMPIEIVTALLIAYPNGACSSDKNGQIPLHLAVKRNVDLVIIEYLLKHYPEGALQVDKYGFNCMNYAIENDVSINIYELLLKANQKCATHCIKGKSVLHHAVEFKRSYSVIKLIVDSYPYATKIQEPIEGRLAMHWAIERLLDLDILLCIDDANPKEGASVKNHRGWCSIHYAIHYPTPVEIVRRILKAYPDIIIDLTYPLHKQYQKEDNKFKLQNDNSNSLLKTYPSEILNINCIQHNESEEVKEEPENKQQDDGIDSQIISDNDIEDSLARNTIEVVNRSTNYLLLHYAVAHQALFETVAEILILTMPYKPDGTFNPRHDDTWAFILGECNDYYWQVIDIVLTKYENSQDLVKTLSLFPDKLVRKAIDIATPKCLYQISRRLNYCSRYEMQRNPIHISNFSILYSAIDHNILVKEKLPVILKFSKDRNAFIHEISIREQINFSTDYVMNMINHYNAQVDNNYRMELLRNNFGEYLYLSVFLAAEKDLCSIISHEYFAGKIDELIKKHCYQILFAVQYIHKEGVVHGNIKPSNIVRQNGFLKLINFGKACRYSYQELVTAELDHLAYSSPELVQLQLSKHIKTTKDIKTATIHSGKAQQPVVDEGNEHNVANDLFPEPDQVGQRILAHPSQDMWSVGAILYYLCSGEPLFLSNLDEHIDSEQLDMLSDWPEFVKQKRLDKIKNPIARNLVSQLLSRDPILRPSAEYCITKHPYFNDNVDNVDSIERTRFPGMSSKYDVYISYRKEMHDNQLQDFPDIMVKDEDHYKILVHCFSQCGLHVAEHTSIDSITKRAYMMIQSSAAVLLFSRYAFNKSNQSPTKEDEQRREFFGSGPMNYFERMRSSSAFDEFLFELRFATELRSIGLLENGLFIIAVGDALCDINDEVHIVTNQDLDIINLDIWKNITYTAYFQQYYGEMVGRYGGSHTKAMPDISVVSVESFLERFLNQTGYGISLQKDLTLLEMFRYLIRLPIFFIIGQQKTTFESIVKKISELISGTSIICNDLLDRNISSAPIVSDVILSRPTTAAFDMLLRSKIRTPTTIPRPSSSKDIISSSEIIYTDRIIKSPLTGLRVKEYTPNHDSPRKLTSQQRPISSGNNNSFRNKTNITNNLINPTMMNSSGIYNEYNDKLFSPDQTFNLPIKPWIEDIVENSNTEMNNDLTYIDATTNNHSNSYNKLPYFTELIGEDKIRTSTALNFMSSKLEISENHIANLQDELTLLREKMNSSDTELIKLRNQLSRDSIRYK